MHAGTNGVLGGGELLCLALRGTLSMGKARSLNSNWYGSDESSELLLSRQVN